MNGIVFPFCTNLISLVASTWFACLLIARRNAIFLRGRLELQLIHLAFADVGCHLANLVYGLYYSTVYRDAIDSFKDEGLCFGLRWIRMMFQCAAIVTEAFIAIGFTCQAFRVTGESMLQILRITWMAWPLAALLASIEACLSFHIYWDLIKSDVCIPLPRDIVIRIFRATGFSITIGCYILVSVACFSVGGKHMCRKACRSLSTYPTISLLTSGPLFFVAANKDIYHHAHEVVWAYTLQGCNGVLNALTYAARLRNCCEPLLQSQGRQCLAVDTPLGVSDASSDVESSDIENDDFCVQQRSSRWFSQTIA
eukprot:TRINITY_DN58220_c0_g1_i1.p1 TRINITY_DN58220_c0_g1~~TRINITY_DN58220_c0_g1_i1.p1  ORF type:complete len:311 (-),score=21.02 TRINITY_DN58220_c0_g1_i1:38-970(-)